MNDALIVLAKCTDIGSKLKQGCSETKMQLHQVLLRDCNQVQNEYDPARSPLAKFSNSTFEQCEGSNRVSLEASFRFLFTIALD